MSCELGHAADRRVMVRFQRRRGSTHSERKTASDDRANSLRRRGKSWGTSDRERERVLNVDSSTAGCAALRVLTAKPAAVRRRTAGAGQGRLVEGQPCCGASLRRISRLSASPISASEVPSNIEIGKAGPSSGGRRRLRSRDHPGNDVDQEQPYQDQVSVIQPPTSGPPVSTRTACEGGDNQVQPSSRRRKTGREYRGIRVPPAKPSTREDEDVETAAERTASEARVED